MAMIIVLPELIVLSYLARRVTSQLFLFFLLLFGSKTVALSLTTAILFPGTVIHELSHLFTAEILGVPTGKLTLTPEAIDGPSFAEAASFAGVATKAESAGKEEIRSGSVAITQTDPIRRTIIGLAPVLVGLTAITFISYFLSQPTENLSNIFRLSLSPGQVMAFRILFFYLLFVISNTMFSSQEDLKGVVQVFLTIGLFTAAGYLFGIRIVFTGQMLTVTQQIATGLTQSLGLVLAINGVILLTIKVLVVLAGKTFHRLPG